MLNTHFTKLDNNFSCHTFEMKLLKEIKLWVFPFSTFFYSRFKVALTMPGFPFAHIGFESLHAL